MFWIIRDIGICWFFDGLSHQGRSTINGSVFQEQYRLIVLVSFKLTDEIAYFLVTFQMDSSQYSITAEPFLCTVRST